MERSYRDSLPIRVFRSSRLANEYAPAQIGRITTYQYDGLYLINQVQNSSREIVQMPLEESFSLSIPRGKSVDDGYLFSLFRKEEDCSTSNKQLCCLFHKRKANPFTVIEFKRHWKTQENRRKENNFIPSGHINGKFKPLVFDSKCQTKCVSRNSGTCPRDVKHILPMMMDNFLEQQQFTTKPTPKLKRLKEFRFPVFRPANKLLMSSAHSMIHQILPKDDCEELEASLLAFEYWKQWKPTKTYVRMDCLYFSVFGMKYPNYPGRM